MSGADGNDNQDGSLEDDAKLAAKDDDDDDDSSSVTEDEAPRRWKGKAKEREVILPRGSDPETDPEPAPAPMPPSSAMFSFPAPPEAAAATAPAPTETLDAASRYGPGGADMALGTEYGAFPKSEADWVLSTKPNSTHVSWEKTIDKGDRGQGSKSSRSSRQKRAEISSSKDLPEKWARTADRAPQKLPVRFIDAVGRNFIWPWERAKSWKVSPLFPETRL